MTPEEIYDQKLQRAFHLEELGRYKESNDILLECIDGGGDDWYIWITIATNYRSLSEYDKALAAIHESLSINPDEVEAINVKALILVALKGVKESKKLLHYSLELNAHNPDAFAYLAAIAIEEEKYKKALNYIESGLAIDPDHDALKRLKVNVSVYSSDLDLQQHINDYLEENPESGSVISLNAAHAIDRGDLEKAEALAYQALEIDPSDKLAKFVLLHVRKNSSWLLRFFVARSFQTYTIQWTVWRVIVMILVWKGVMIWGAFLVLYMLVTWVGGVTYNTWIRRDPRLSLMLLPHQIKQSNYYLVNLSVIVLLTIMQYISDQPLIDKAMVWAVVALFIGISYFEVNSRKVKMRFFISTILLLCMMYFATISTVTASVIVGVLCIILHGFFFSVRIIGE